MRYVMGPGGMNYLPDLPPGQTDEQPKPGKPPKVTKVEAQTDPYLERQAGRIEANLDNFAPRTQQLIDTTVSGIRDQTEGRRRAMRAMVGERGLSGTGFEGGFERGLIGDETAATGKATADINLGRERDYTQALYGAQPGIEAPGEAQRADKYVGLAAEGSNRSDTQMYLDQQRSELDDYFKYLDQALQLNQGDLYANPDPYQQPQYQNNGPIGNGGRIWAPHF
jgi:hypothetical protein